MFISREDAIAIFAKWKDESADILAVADSDIRQGPRDLRERSLGWAMKQRVKVSRVSFPGDMEDSTKWAVEFEGPAGSLALSIGSCQFDYADAREAAPDIKEEMDAMSVASLSMHFANGAGFLFYELREP